MMNESYGAARRKFYGAAAEDDLGRQRAPAVAVADGTTAEDYLNL